MALDFSLSVVQSLIASNVATAVTITLTGTGTLGTTATFTATGAGTPSATPTIASGQGPGATATLNWTTTATGLVTVTATGGLTGSKTILLTVAKPNTVTAQQIIDQAWGILGVSEPGEPTDPNQAQSGLLRLNMMLDSWRIDSSYAYSSSSFTGTLKSGLSSLTIGPSGDIVTPYRPISIEDGSFFSSSNLDYSLRQITQEQYNGIYMKTVGTIGPGGFYYSPDLPNGTIYFYPQPSSDVKLTLVGLLEMTEFQDLTTQYVLAPGYRKALAYSLAEEMAPDFQKPPSPLVSQMAANARRALRKANYSTPMMNKPRMRGNVYVGWEN